MPIIPGLGRLRLRDHFKFEASLGQERNSEGRRGRREKERESERALLAYWRERNTHTHT